jgi:hypothetical protein
MTARSKSLRRRPVVVPSTDRLDAPTARPSRVVEARTKIGRRRFIAVSSALAGVAVAPRNAGAAAPVWATIPDQIWTVGVPVWLDLADFVDDPDGDELVFTLDMALPPGVTLQGSVISGTPSEPFEETVYVASADDAEGGDSSGGATTTDGTATDPTTSGEPTSGGEGDGDGGAADPASGCGCTSAGPGQAIAGLAVAAALGSALRRRCTDRTEDPTHNGEA